MSTDILFLTQARIAQITVGPSTIRTQPKGTKDVAVEYLKNLDLSDFNSTSDVHFQKILDEKTSELQKILPRQSWGISRKIMNIFLIQCFHDKFISEKYNLDELKDYLELPLDKKNAKNIEKEADKEWKELSKWTTITDLTKDISYEYQKYARYIAKKMDIARYQLDLCWWRAKDNYTIK